MIVKKNAGAANGDQQAPDIVARRPSVPEGRLAAFCRRHHIKRLALFGSALRGDFRPDSDIDVLVEFEQGHTPDFFKLADMEDELSTLFGRKIDLRTPRDLSRYFRDRVAREAEVQYSSDLTTLAGSAIFLMPPVRRSTSHRERLKMNLKPTGY